MSSSKRKYTWSDYAKIVITLMLFIVLPSIQAGWVTPLGIFFGGYGNGGTTIDQDGIKTDGNLTIGGGIYNISTYNINVTGNVVIDGNLTVNGNLIVKGDLIVNNSGMGMYIIPSCQVIGNLSVVDEC